MQETTQKSIIKKKRNGNVKTADRLLARKIAWEIESLITELENITPEHSDLHAVLTNVYGRLIQVNKKARALIDNLAINVLTKEEKNDLRNR